MQEVKSIICDDEKGETLWEGILLPKRNGNYEGFIHSSVTATLINFEYIAGCDVKMTLKRTPMNNNSICNTSIYDLVLLNRLGISEWFVTENKNTILCTQELVSNNLAKTYRKELDNVKKHICK